MNGNTVIGGTIVAGYRETRARARAELRRGILDAAGRLLTQEGAHALTMRRIAREVGCSTKVLYTLYGNKEGVVNEIYLEGFDRLHRAFARVPRTAEPLAYLVALAWAYRAHAHAEPTYYGVMFERAIPGFAPPQESVRRANASFRTLVEAVRACMAAGQCAAYDPVAVGDVLAAQAHGLVSLERAGYFPDPDEARRRYALAVEMALGGLRPPATEAGVHRPAHDQ